MIGLNMPQQMNDYNQLKYNSNLGINDINSASQISLMSLNNPLLADLNNILNNPFSRLLGQSNEDFEKSGLLNINEISSSKNFIYSKLSK